MTLNQFPTLLLTVVALSMAVSACGDGEDDNGVAKVVSAAGVDVLIQSEPPPDAAGGIGISGVFEVASGCLGVRMGDEPVLLILPRSSQVREIAGELVVSVGGSDFSIGDSFNGGSRSSEAQPLSEIGVRGSVAPESCGGLRAILLDEISK